MNKLCVEENCSSICLSRNDCVKGGEGNKQSTSNMDLQCISDQGTQIQTLKQEENQSNRIPRKIREQLQKMINDKVIQEFKYKDLEFSENDQIGKGGFGKVYKCKIKCQKGSQLVAALKIIETDNQASKLKAMRKFLEEVKIHSSIRHDNIMLLQGISFDVKLCLIMPLMQLSLLEIIEQKDQTFKKIRKEKRLKFLLQIAKGIQWLHAQGIIHRDLKPNNILIDQFYNAKISDLGLAVLQDYLGQHQQSGTRYYQAPEVFNKNYQATQAIDIWGFACIAVSLLRNGRQNSFTDLKKQELQENEISKLLTQIPFQYRNILAKCFSQNPQDRPSSDQIVQFLESMQNEQIMKLKKNKQKNQYNSQVVSIHQNVKANQQFTQTAAFESRDDINKLNQKVSDPKVNESQKIKEKIEDSLKLQQNEAKLEKSPKEKILKQLEKLNLSSFLEIIDYENLTLEENQLIGKGGFGEVFKCLMHNNDLQQEVAVKTIKITLKNDELDDYIINEIKIQMSIKHDSLLQL